VNDSAARTGQRFFFSYKRIISLEQSKFQQQRLMMMMRLYPRPLACVVLQLGWLSEFVVRNLGFPSVCDFLRRVHLGDVH